MQDLTAGDEGSFTIYLGQESYCLLTAEFEQGTAQYLFRSTIYNPDGSQRIYGTDSVGAVDTSLDYVGNERLVCHNYFGLCVYDLERAELLCRVDFQQSLGCNWMQGSQTVQVDVSADGSCAMGYLSHGGAVNGSAVYVDLASGEVWMGEYEEMSAAAPSPEGQLQRATDQGRICDLQYTDGTRIWDLFPEGYIPNAELRLP